MSRARDQRVKQMQNKNITKNKMPASKNQYKEFEERAIEDVWCISEPISFEKKQSGGYVSRDNRSSSQSDKKNTNPKLTKQVSMGRARAKQAKQDVKIDSHKREQRSSAPDSVNRSQTSVVDSHQKADQQKKNFFEDKLITNPASSMTAFILVMLLITLIIVIVCIVNKEPEPVIEQPTVLQKTEPDTPEVSHYPEGTEPFVLGSTTQLVNKFHSLPEDYEPDNLVLLSLPSMGDQYLREDAASALIDLFQASQADGIKFVCCSGFRSYETQASLYANTVQSDGQEEADRSTALPGNSEHQSGLAMDLTSVAMNYTLEESFINTPEGQWLAAHAHEYGYIIRYPKGSESITGYIYEPWHIRYLGEKVAQAVYESGKTYEEYLDIFD